MGNFFGFLRASNWQPYFWVISYLLAFFTTRFQFSWFIVSCSSIRYLQYTSVIVSYWVFNILWKPAIYVKIATTFFYHTHTWVSFPIFLFDQHQCAQYMTVWQPLFKIFLDVTPPPLPTTAPPIKSTNREPWTSDYRHSAGEFWTFF